MLNGPCKRLILKAVLGAVAAVIIAACALRFASSLWASIIFTITLSLLATSILGVSFARGRARMAWLGFALFGGSYYWLVLGPASGNGRAPQLATTQTLLFLESVVQPPSVNTPPQLVYTTGWDDPFVGDSSGSIVVTGFNGMRNVNFRTGNQLFAVPATPFLQIGQSLWTLILGGLGALSAAWFSRTQGIHKS